MRWDRISLLVDRMKEDLESYGFVYLPLPYILGC